MREGLPTPFIPHHGQMPNAVTKRRKVEIEPSSTRADVLSARDAATLLQSLGLELLNDSPSDWSHACRGHNGNMDLHSESSTDTASTCSDHYSSG